MPPRNLLFIVLTAMISFACYLKAERNRYAVQIAEAMKVVGDLYVDPIDQRDLFEHAMGGMLEGLDQYSSYVGPEVYQAMGQSLDQEFGGVGIEVEKESDDAPILVLTPLFDSPGYRAGLRSGDLILAIDGLNTRGMKQKDAISRMRGPPGSKVKLSIRHADSPEELQIEVVRDVIVVNSLLGDTRRPDGTWDYHLRDDPRIGYLRLISFGKHSGEELSRVLGDGQGCPFEAIILDLRDNAGGLLDTAVEVCDLFLDRGRIVSTRGRDGVDRRVFDATESTIIPATVPMVVLINKFSASASEIVAACLQDHGRAVVIGERSWGKGTVQNLFELEGGRSALKLTTATYWRPSQKNIHRRENAPENEDWGVRPSPGFEVKVTDEQLRQIYVTRRERDTGRKLPPPRGAGAPGPLDEGPSPPAKGAALPSAIPAPPLDAVSPALPSTSSPPAAAPPASPPAASPAVTPESPGAGPAVPSAPDRPDGGAPAAGEAAEPSPAVSDPQLDKARKYLEAQLPERAREKS